MLRLPDFLLVTGLSSLTVLMLAVLMVQRIQSNGSSTPLKNTDLRSYLMFMPSKTPRTVLTTLDGLARLSGGLRTDSTTGVTRVLTGSVIGTRILSLTTILTKITLTGLWIPLMDSWNNGVITLLFMLLNLLTNHGATLPETLLWTSTAAYAT